MKIYLIILISIVSQLNTVTTDVYENSKQCVQIIPEKKIDCTRVPPDYYETYRGKQRTIACCYTTYDTEEEGNLKKCVPLYKTINGLHMYKEQLKNMGATSISIDCHSMKLIISSLMILILNLLLL